MEFKTFLLNVLMIEYRPKVAYVYILLWIYSLQVYIPMLQVVLQI